MRKKSQKVTPNNCIKFGITSLVIVSLSLNSVLLSDIFAKHYSLSHKTYVASLNSLHHVQNTHLSVKNTKLNTLQQEATYLSSPEPLKIDEIIQEVIEEQNNQYAALRESGDIEGYIDLICQDYGIRPELIKAIIQVESNWNVNATNGPHIGLMQINQYIHSGRMSDLGLDNITDPFNNVLVGTDLMSDLLQTYGGDEGAALTAYNTGSYKGYYTYYATKVLNIANN